MINGRQIRAARALVDMSQDELAEAAGLTPQAIRKIESNKVTPREGTISDIMKVFRNHRIEFIDNQGVRFIPEDVEVLNGKEGIRRFFDLVFEHAQTSGGTIRQNGIGDKTFFDCAPEETAEQGARMAILVPKRKNIYVRAILANGNMDFMYSQYADYRWRPNDLPPSVPYYLFGDYIGIFAFRSSLEPKIVLISSPTISSVYKIQFDETWDMADIPPKERKA